ncbi:MAG TPA: rRNA adenine N-6-methyltransferase family protein [Victivallales bacterium]|nr:rRNA adenine N-6-methyltransferase family protein [Victivallales bacterium]
MKLAIIKEFLRSPRTVGTVFPSSRHLAHQMTAGIGIERARSVVEIGPGSGAFTGDIVKKMSADAKFIMVELNRDFYSRLTQRYPTLKVINDSAERLVEILRGENIEKADVVVSGLPWAVFPETLRTRIMGQIHDCLADGGHFSTYAYFQGCYLPSGRKFKKMLTEKFAEVRRSPLVIRNLPPAYVYHCKKH